MICRENRAYPPSMAEISDYIHNPLWDTFCAYLEKNYRVKPALAFSKCSWEPGWNIRFQKGGRSLCTVYPRENTFAVMVVIGRKEKGRFEAALPSFRPEIQQIYRDTQEGNGQKWLMIELENHDALYEDVKRMLEIRASGKVMLSSAPE